MPENDNAPTFLACERDNTVLVRIRGRANFNNSQPLQKYLEKMIEAGKTSIIIDFKDCASMDSTFMGIIAAVGSRALRAKPPTNVILCCMGRRNKELACNLGLDRVVVVEKNEAELEAQSASFKPLYGDRLSQDQAARLVLDAHEALCEVDETNRERFNDVITLLKKQLGEESPG